MSKNEIERPEFIDPVFQGKDGFWYHWDECWAWEHGPFFDEEEARRELDRYCEENL